MGTTGLLPVVILVAWSLALALTDAKSIAATDSSKVTDKCDSDVFCRGPLLRTVQLAEIFNDSKTFVDLSQRNSPNVTLSKTMMQATNNKPSRDQVQKFVQDNFLMEDELYNVTLPDWTQFPTILKNIEDPNYRAWAYELNAIWKTLARRMTDNVAKNPDRHSLIYVNNTFIIPGGRFKEFYYWDSYWIMLGLLICDMPQTVKGMVENFALMVDKYNFVPNGGRVYYLMRSQPPFFIPMVTLYVEKTNDLEFLRTMIPTMEKEFSYWQTQKTVDVRKDGKTYKMVHYVVDSPEPRPESYREDYLMAQQLPEGKRAAFYNDMKAAAESGWDFSNRWCIEEDKNVGALSLLNVSTRDIIPVDLNAFVQSNARMLSESHEKLGNAAKAAVYKKIAAAYQAAIDNVLWNEEDGTWCDYDAKNSKPRCAFYPSNLAPLYTGSYDPSMTQTLALKTVNYLKRKNIEGFIGGTPTSLNYTGEQWDFPNAWPPLQSLIVGGLERTQVPEAKSYARLLAEKWVSSNYEGFLEYGKMYEKYSAIEPGKGGGGGEYAVQEGFGWTNGVILEFLNIYRDLRPTELSSESSDYSRSDSQDSTDNYDYARLRRSIRQSWEE